MLVLVFPTLRPASRDLLAVFSDIYLTPLAFDALDDGDPLELYGLLLVMARLQPGEGRMMIDLVVWAQSIHQRDKHTDTQTATSPQQ